MNKYLIYCDVSADVDPAYLNEDCLRFIPMQYSLGDSMLTYDGTRTDEDMKRFYDGQRKGDLTRTSQVTPQQYKDLFSPLMAEGTSVLCIVLSSGLSSTFQSAGLAAESLNSKYADAKMIPIDSLAATGGMGILCERAVANYKKGMSLEENAADLEALTHKIRHWFLVQDLDYLKRGGRVSAATAMVGGLLNIKPILQIDKEGKLTTEHKERGYKAAARKLVQLFEESYDPASEDTIYINHSDAGDVAEMLKKEILSLHPGKKVCITMLTPIIGAHTGPNMAAVIFVEK